MSCPYSKSWRVVLCTWAFQSLFQNVYQRRQAPKHNGPPVYLTVTVAYSLPVGCLKALGSNGTDVISSVLVLKCCPALELGTLCVFAESDWIFPCFRLPFTFVTKEVADATCECLLAQAEQAEKMGKSKAAAERMILEEFGRCLMRVINSAGKSKSDPCAMNC